MKKIKMINVTTGNEMWVSKERVEEYEKAGHKKAGKKTSAQKDSATKGNKPVAEEETDKNTAEEK